MQDNAIFAQLSIMIVVGGIISIIMRLLRQPLIIGYILTGILVGPSVLNLIHDKETFASYSQIGITLLLFIIGLGLKFSIVKSLGKVAFVITSVNLLVMPTIGLLIAMAFGYPAKAGLVIGMALLFSSTIIILKVLSDKRELTRLHGQIATGVVLVEDLVATFALLFVAAAGTSDGLSAPALLKLLLSGAGLAAGLFVVSKYILPRITKFLASSQELLFLFTISWGFGIATLFELAGFSHEIGALFGGVSLASLPYATEMASRLKPLRDFFVVLFFVVLGENLAFGSVQSVWLPALVLSVIVVIVKPLTVLASMGALGYTKLTSFKTAVNLSQISEFSIILVMYAVAVGLADNSLLTMMTVIALVTTSTSTYLMKYDDQIYKKLEPLLRLFERRTIKEFHKKQAAYSVILFGYHRGGYEYVQTFRDMKQRYMVVDYDPDVIEHLEQQGIRNTYGDATDEELLHEINMQKAKLAISVIADPGINRALLAYLRAHNPTAVFICHANSYDEAADLYHHGATYVVLPHLLGTEKIGGFLKKHGFNRKAFDLYRKQHVVSLGKSALKR